MKSPDGAELPADPLLVSDYDGHSGSGKSTIIDHLIEVLPQVSRINMPRVVSEATGIYYRALAAQFLQEGSLGPGASQEEVQGLAEFLNLEEIGDIINSGQANLLATYGIEVLKSPEVNSIVSYLPRIEVVRSGVRSGFQSRLQKLAQLPPDHPERPSLVLADGRNLRPLVRGVAGAKLLLSHFVTCSSVAAAARECRRRELNGEMIDLAEAKKILDTIQSRNYADAANPHNPGREDNDAYVLAPIKDEAPHENYLLGMGMEATNKERQVHFDTTHLSQPNMLKAAKLLIVGAWVGLDIANRLRPTI